MIIEPIAGVFAGPSSGNNRRIPNEDSLGYEFRDSDLFRADRLAGYDLLDTGQRVDYGMKLGLYNKDGGNYRMLIGQSLRAETNPFLPAASGAAQRLSDVVGRVVLSPSSYLDVIYRVKTEFGYPTAAYSVSAEYSMVKAAGAKGWIDERAVTLESLLAMRRAGADILITYAAVDVARWLKEK